MWPSSLSKGRKIYVCREELQSPMAKGMDTERGKELGLLNRNFHTGEGACEGALYFFLLRKAGEVIARS